MANRFVLNTVSYHGKGAIERSRRLLVAVTRRFVCSDPDSLEFRA